MTPMVLITADGKPFAMDRVLSVEITDEAGFESDELIITLDDADPQIARPREGALLGVAIGYKETGLVDFGSYVFEELSREGWPRIMTLSAKAADHAKSLKEPKTRTWENTTLAAIVAKIAAEHGLTPQVDSQMGAHAVPFLAQTEESDQNLLDAPRPAHRRGHHAEGSAAAGDQAPQWQDRLWQGHAAAAGHPAHAAGGPRLFHPAQAPRPLFRDPRPLARPPGRAHQIGQRQNRPGRPVDNSSRGLSERG